MGLFVRVLFGFFFLNKLEKDLLQVADSHKRRQRENESQVFAMRQNDKLLTTDEYCILQPVVDEPECLQTACCSLTFRDC